MAGTPTQYYGFPTYADSDAVDLTAQYNTAVTNIDSELHQIDTKVTERKTTAVYLGNSFSAGVGDDKGGLFGRTKDLFDDAYLFQSSAAGFIDWDGAHKTFGELLQQAIDSPSVDNDAVTDVIIVGAWGDSSTIGSFTGYINNSIDTIRDAAMTLRGTAESAFPGARVRYIFAESRGPENYDREGNALSDCATWVAYMDYCLAHAAIENMGWIGLPILMQDQYFDGDNTHPNPRGYAILAERMRARLTGHEKTFTKAYAVSGVPGLDTMYVTVDDDMNMTFSLVRLSTALQDNVTTPVPGIPIPKVTTNRDYLVKITADTAVITVGCENDKMIVRTTGTVSAQTYPYVSVPLVVRGL